MSTSTARCGAPATGSVLPTLPDEERRLAPLTVGLEQPLQVGERDPEVAIGRIEIEVGPERIDDLVAARRAVEHEEQQQRAHTLAVPVGAGTSRRRRTAPMARERRGAPFASGRG